MAPRWRPTPGQAWAVLGLGLLLMAGAGLQADRFGANSFHPDRPPCRFAPDGCPPPEEAAAFLRALWWWVAAGGAVALVGVAMTVWLASTTPRGPSRARPAAPLHAVVAGLVGAALLGLLLVPLLVALLTGPQAVPVALSAAWLLQARALAALDSALGHPSGTPRRSWSTALVVSAAALGAAAWVCTVVGAAGSWGMPAVAADGLTVGVGVLAGRLLTDPSSDRRAVRAALAVALAVVAAPVVLLAVPQALLPRPDLPVRAEPRPAAPTTEPPAPTTTLPPPAPETTTPPPPAPETTTPPPPVDADVACTPADLRFAVPGVDGAMGARGAAVQATNVGAQPCWVEGVPVVTLLQGGRPLRLTVEPGQAPTGGPAVVQRVGIAPGGTALALLTWRTYAGRADDTTPQTMTVALAAGQPAVDVGILSDHGAAPFDIADGGRWGIAPWAAPWN